MRSGAKATTVRTIGVILITAVTLFAGPARAVTCGPHLVAPLFPFEDPRPGLVTRYLLGAGAQTETWLLRDGADYVAEKQYRRTNIFNLEVSSFEGLRWLLAQGEPTGFAYPRGLDVKPPSAYRITYAPGRTVQDLLRADGGVPPYLRLLIRAKYLAAFARVKALAEIHVGPQHEMTWDDGSPWLWINMAPGQIPGGTGVREKVHVTIKPDNVIVDPWTLEMTIIDPF